MKKYLTVLAVALFLSTPAQAGMLDSLMSSGWETKKPTVKYTLETQGYDVRVYEWIPENNKNVRCVFVAGNKNSSGVSCYNKK